MARPFLPLMLAFGVLGMASPLAAADLQQTANLPLAQVAFDDQPVILPVTDSFNTAMHSVATDIGKHCTTTEAYGWRLQQTEQPRVNTIFNSVAGKLSTAGYNLQPQTPPSATREVTVFTAQKQGHDLLFMWSAGELGLVLLVCETQNGATAAPEATVAPTSVQEEPAVVEQPKQPAPKAKPTKPKAKKAKPQAKASKAHDALPPVVREDSVAEPSDAVPVKSNKPGKAEPMSPEVKAMLDSLPPAQPAPAEPPAAMPDAPPAVEPTPVTDPAKLVPATPTGRANLPLQPVPDAPPPVAPVDTAPTPTEPMPPLPTPNVTNGVPLAAPPEVMPETPKPAPNPTPAQ